MATTAVQIATANLGAVTSGSCAFSAAVTAGNTIEVEVAVTQFGSVTTTSVITVTDTNGGTPDTITKQAFAGSVGGGGAGGVWIWATTSPVVGGSTTVFFTFASVGYFQVKITEYPPTGGVRNANGIAQFGGTAVVPNVTISGVVAGDLICGIAADGNSKFSGSTTGTIDGSSANVTNVTSDNQVSLDIPSASPTSGISTIAWGSVTDDFWCSAGIAFSPSGPPPPPVYPTLLAQQRALGFPPNAPLPGIARLGAGLLKPAVLVPPTIVAAQKLGGLRQVALLSNSLRTQVLQVHKRAPGFPPRAPLPGIARLGVGLLQAQPTPIVNVTIAAAQQLGALGQSVTLAESPRFSAAQQLGGLRQSVTLAETIALTAAQQLGGLRQSATLNTGGNTLAVAQRLGGLRQSVTLAETIALVAAQKLGGLRQSSTLAETIALSAAQKLGGLRQSVTLAEAPRFAAAQQIGGLRQSVTLAETASLAAAQKLGTLRQSVTLAETIALTAAQKLGGLRQSATLTSLSGNTLAAAQKLGGLRQSVTLAEAPRFAAAQQLGGLRQSVTLAEKMSLSAAQHLGGLRQSITLAETIALAAAQRLGGLRQSVALAEVLSLSAAQHLGGLRQSATLNERINVATAQHLGGLRQSAALNVNNGQAPVTLVCAQRLGGLRQTVIVKQGPKPKIAIYWSSYDEGAGLVMSGYPRRQTRRIWR